MRKLTNFSVNYPVTVLMVVLGVLLLGIISYQKLGIDLFPDLNSPRVFIEIKSGERPPEEMESLFIDNIEALAIRQSDVLEVSSITRTGTSQIAVNYTWEKDMDEAFLDLQKALTNYSQNSDDLEITITQHDPNTLPVMVVALAHESVKDMNELRKVAENYIRNELVRLEGIAEVELAGQEESEVTIITDRYKLASFNLTLDGLSQRIESFNRNISGGSITETGLQYIVKGVSLLQKKEDFENVVVGYKGIVADDENAVKVPILLREVAKVEFTNKEPENIVRVNGERCIGLSIFKETKFNTVSAVEDIIESLEEIKKALPGYKFTIISNQGTFIRNAISEVNETLLAGIVLAIFVIFLFLRKLGTTIIISLAIPISVVATFNLMYFNDLTLNIMTLGGLALGAGMLVDNAIVVMESIFRNHESGMSAKEAAIEGTSQVGGAIIASTLTTIVVFLPIVYLQGASGELFKDQAWTVAFSLVSSLLVAIFLIPMMYNFFFSGKEFKKSKESLRVKGYGKFLAGILPYRWLVVLVAGVLIGIALILVPFIGSEFMPKAESREFAINVKLPEGTTLEHTSSAIETMENIIEQLLGDEAELIYSRIGPSTGMAALQGTVFEGENTAQIKISLKPDGKYKSSQVIEAISGWYKDNPDFDVRFVRDETALQSILGTEEAPVVIEVKGESLTVIEDLSKQIMEKIGAVEELFNLRTNMEKGYPEMNIVVDRFRAGAYNISVDEIVNQVSSQLEGKAAGQMEKDGEMRDISIRVPEIELSSFSDITITSGNREFRLDEIAKLEEGVSPREIYHRNQNRIGKVMANLHKSATLDKVVGKIQEKIATIDVPSQYNIKVTGEEQKREESIGNLKFALLLSIVLVFMVLASQFESLIQPFVILLTIPLSIVGSVLLFFVMGMPFNIMAIIGIIMLGGIAVNDSIIFVDRINQLRVEGIAKHEAIVLAGQQRIRPIVMTSLTTILALLPLTFGFGEGASLRSPMALAVIGGLVTSTLLTLVVIPCVYDLFTKEKVNKVAE